MLVNAREFTCNDNSQQCDTCRGLSQYHHGIPCAETSLFVIHSSTSGMLSEIRDPNIKTKHHALSWDDESLAALRAFLDFFFFLSFSLLFFAFLSFLLCPCLCFSRMASASSTLPISAQRQVCHDLWDISSSARLVFLHKPSEHALQVYSRRTDALTSRWGGMLRQIASTRGHAGRRRRWQSRQHLIPQQLILLAI